MLRDLLRVSSGRCTYTTFYALSEETPPVPPKGLEFSEQTRCLLLSPHPDDELIGCGGTLLQYAKHFDVLCLSSSGRDYLNTISAEEDSRIRTSDFNAIMAELKVNRHLIFEHWEKNHSREFYQKMLDSYCRAVYLADYDYVFLPHPQDNHPDHQYVVRLVEEMMRRQNISGETLRLVFYEVWSPMSNPNACVIIDHVINKKQNILRRYRNAGGAYIEPVTGLNRYRGLNMTVFQHDYAEAFTVVKAAGFFK
jgi:LmbE family N-acetylglucosaminyl deacetylase